MDEFENLLVCIPELAARSSLQIDVNALESPISLRFSPIIFVLNILSPVETWLICIFKTVASFQRYRLKYPCLYTALIIVEGGDFNICPANMTSSSILFWKRMPPQ